MPTLKNKKIVILCGHHGENTGTAGNGLDEFMENAWCSCALIVRLANEGYDAEIIMIQNIDENGEKDMSRRIKEMDSSADLFISIHHNGVEDSSAHGAEILYWGDISKALAEVFAPFLEDDLGLRWRGLKRRPDLAVLKQGLKLGIPTVVIEGGFITNQQDAFHIGHVSWPDRLAQASVKAINRHFDV